MDAGKIGRAIEIALEADGFGDSATRHDIAFHMTDWLDDLKDWHRFCETPQNFDADETVKLLVGFLVHAPNHMAAASKLLTGIPVMDIFQVGAVETADQE
ncbi:MAG: hypothetical protein HKN43_04590 [Rhodothermales bacterium]|nr:hypothetical protein [Rhodothermales bacterium]